MAADSDDDNVYCGKAPWQSVNNHTGVSGIVTELLSYEADLPLKASVQRITRLNRKRLAEMRMGTGTAMDQLPNVGPITARRLAEVGISSQAVLQDVGSVEAYVRLRFRFGRLVTLNALWAMEAALLGIDWRHLSDERKGELAQRLPSQGGHAKVKGGR